jgi:hypothetical protein
LVGKREVSFGFINIGFERVAPFIPAPDLPTPWSLAVAGCHAPAFM